MNEKLLSLLKEQYQNDKATLIKIDAGTMTVEQIGYNPKLLQDEMRIIDQFLYLQEVKAEIASQSQSKEDV